MNLDDQLKAAKKEVERLESEIESSLFTENGVYLCEGKVGSGGFDGKRAYVCVYGDSASLFFKDGHTDRYSPIKGLRKSFNLIKKIDPKELCFS